ncbi:MAG: glycine cleavage system aminomethyltransferase GcvT [Verrucomicrobiae bacterium]|nr:glycine cleavage system aminomethyltransferase GcvT [Verrucomicrobiae bacterium]
MAFTTDLKPTPLCDEHKRLGARMVGFGGWLMPVQYASILQEHHAVRKACGLFDISHMGEVRVTGHGAADYLNNLLTNDVRKLAVGQAQYSFLCNEHGGVIDDLYVYRIGEETYLLLINASHIEKDFLWMQSQRRNHDVALENVSDKTSALALQGPNAVALLEQLSPGISAAIPRNHVARKNILGHDVFVARTGYTGEDGMELVLFNEAALQVWRKLIHLGATPCGLGARDTLRLEMCYPLHGNDLSEATTPIEAGLGFFVALDKPSFVGKEVLQQQKQVGTEKRLVAFTMNERGAIPRQHHAIARAGSPAGEVTSGSMSPSLNIGIGMGYVKPESAKVGELLEIEIRGKKSPATIVNKPFYRPQKS